MGRIIQDWLIRLENRIYQWEIQQRDSIMQRHFHNVSADTVVDIDKYLRARGWI
jgi:hypothetical protein